MTVAEALQLMLAFGAFVVSLVKLMLAIIDKKTKK